MTDVNPLHGFLRVDPDAPIPLAAQLSEQLMWLVASGKLAVGDELPPARGLADVLGINYHTVRSAYQQLRSAGVIVTRRGTRATVVNYDRKRLGSNAPRLPTFALGVLVPNYSPYHARFLDGLEEATHSDPWLKFICDTHYYSRHVARYMDQLVAKNVDGIIVTHFELAHDPEARAHLAHSHGLPPIVYADSPGMDGPGVGFDRVQGAFEVTDHLAGHGHQRIGLITPSLEWSTLRSVYKGYQRALKQHDLVEHPDLVVTVPTFSAEDGSQGMDRLLDLSDPPTAVFASGDMLAIGAVRRAKERGRRVPQDLAFAGFGEIDLASMVDPGLTTVALPPELMGAAVMQMLRQSMAGEEVTPRTKTLDTKLVTRQSCGC